MHFRISMMRIFILNWVLNRASFQINRTLAKECFHNRVMSFIIADLSFFGSDCRIVRSRLPRHASYQVVISHDCYSLYISEVGAESKNSSMVIPVTCFEVNGELKITVRWSCGNTLENQLNSIGLALPLFTSIKSLPGVTKSISCSFESQKPIASGSDWQPRTIRRQSSCTASILG
jgi:hypothetical protein